MTLKGLRHGSGLSLLLWALLALTGCSSTPNPQGRFAFPEEQQAVAGLASDRAYSSVLRPGDLLIISFSDMERPMPLQTVNIPESGLLTLPFNVHVQAAGKTIPQLEKDIRDAYVPSLFVTLTATIKQERRAFFVDGEVKQPGRQEYFGEMTVLRAIGTAGGFTDFANRKKIEVRRSGGQRLFVNYYKALDEPAQDIPVYPNDHIIVKRGLMLW